MRNKIFKHIMFGIGIFVLSASLYAGYQQKLTSGSGPVNNIKVAPTEIIINNATPYYFYAAVPGAYGDLLKILIPSHRYDHIWNDAGSFNTYVVLRRPNGSNFWKGDLCPHASLTVYALEPEAVVVDRTACYH